MAALVRGLLFLGGQALRADLLYILLARGYILNHSIISELPVPSPGVNTNVSRAGTTVIVVTQTTTAPLAASTSTPTPTEHISTTPTVETIPTELTNVASDGTGSRESFETFHTLTTTTTIPTTTITTPPTTSISTSTTTTTTAPSTTTTSISPSTTSTTRKITTPLTTTSSPNSTPGTTSSTDTESQKQQRGSDVQTNLPGCNFPLLFLGALRIQPPPLDVSDIVGLQYWKPLVHQLGEIRHLMGIHREVLVRRQGSHAFDHLRAELENTVEEPLKYACKVLQSYQSTLVDLATNTTGYLAGKRERRSKFASHLEKIEKELKSAPTKKGVLLPSWAREARELWSDKCPNRDCFTINGTTLEGFTTGIPQKFLDTVTKLREDTKWTRDNVWGALTRRLDETCAELLHGFVLFYKSGQLPIAVLIFILCCNLLLLLMPYWRREFRYIGARDRNAEPPPPPPPERFQIQVMPMDQFQQLLPPDGRIPPGFVMPPGFLPPPGVVIPPRFPIPGVDPFIPDFDPADPHPDDGPLEGYEG